MTLAQEAEIRLKIYEGLNDDNLNNSNKCTQDY